MGKRRRKGSSTRKYPIKEYPPASSPKKKKEEKSTPQEFKVEDIEKLEKQIRSGVNFKGSPLTDKEIGIMLTAISHMEGLLGIKHH